MLKLSLRDLRAHVGRYVLTFLAVTIGVCFVSGVITLTDTISRTYDDLFAGLHAGTDAAVRGTAQFELGTQFGGAVQRPRIASALVDEVAAIDGVAAAEGVVQGYARPIGLDGEPYGNPSFGPPTVGMSWGEDPQLNPFELAEGRPPEGPDEIVLDKHTADQTGYGVGDTAEFQTATGVNRATIVGIARFGTADSAAGSARTFMDMATAQSLLAGPGQIDLVAVRAEEGRTQAEVRDAIRSTLGGVDLEVVTGETLVAEEQEAAQTSFTGLRTFLLAFALISVLVGTFVIYTSFSFIVAQRQRQVALLRAIGASRSQMLVSIVVESLVVGALASLLGYGLGVLLAAALASTFVTGAEVAILPRSGALALTVGTVVTVVSAFVPAARAARVPPVAAMRDVAIDVSHRSPVRMVLGGALALAGVAAVGAGLSGHTVRDQSPLRLSGGGMLALFLATIVLAPVAARPASLGFGRPLPLVRGIVGRLAQQNAARNPRRTASTATALMIGLGIVSLFLVVNASVRASLSYLVDDRFSGDMVLDAGTGYAGTGLPGSVEAEVNRLPEVEAASGVRLGFAQVDGEAAMVSGLDVEHAFDLFDVTVTDGDVEDLDADGIGVWEKTARDKGWRVGDEVPVVFGHTGTRNLTVAALFDSKDLTGAYVLGGEAFDANLPDAGAHQVWVRRAAGVSPEQARQALEPIVAPFPSAEVMDVDEFKDLITAQYDVILVMVNALMVLTIVIAMIGIVNTLVLSVVERGREIALTRAVGASRGQVRSSIRWEALLIATFGLTAALAIGVFFGWILVRALADDGFSRFAVPAAQLAAFTAVTGLLTLAAAVVPAAWAGRRHILSAIAER